MLPLTPAGIDTLFKTVQDVPNQDNFEQRFHHSEQALFDHLQQPEVIRSIIEKLQADPHFESGAKVVAIVLNGFSKNYVCPDCAIATMGFQNTREGAFFKSLIAQIISMGCVLPKMSHLRTITLFSAQQPYRQARKSADEHEDLAIDLRAYQNNLVLSQDVTVITPSTTMFTSRK